MRTALLDYSLAPERIAQSPAQRREDARLLVVPAGGGPFAHRCVGDLPALVTEGTLVVVNDTRVLRARLLGKKTPTGGKVELLLARRLGPQKVAIDGAAHELDVWRALGRASKGLRPGVVLDFGELTAHVLGRAEDEGLLEVGLRATGGRPIDEVLRRVGHVPLPPYIRREDDASDGERYQTVFARVDGAVAAPTAGLHLTEEVLAALQSKGCEVASITLHVGYGTFQPVTTEDLDDHAMHAEWFEVSDATAHAVARARERQAPVLAVGTTVVRALESAADPGRPGFVRRLRGETRLLIQPGYAFRVVDRLLTNFHLPRSTLLALVGAFAGLPRIHAAYEAAQHEGYRFYSYGDAMLLGRDGEAFAP